MSIRLISTGGTVGKSYHELTGELNFSQSHITDMLKQARYTAPIEIESVLLKDSLEMTDADRVMISAACEAAVEDRIVITHGTDTMVETAQVLAEAVALKSKIIVLTGAMVPYSFGVTSDALFNLGSALAFVQALDPGIYIAMNGTYFTSADAQKDRQKGIFVTRQK